MAGEVANVAGVSFQHTPAPLYHEEFYVASDGSHWLMQVEVHWAPQFQSRVGLFRMPGRVPVSLPANLPYLDVVPRNIRAAALDGRFDLQAITRYCLTQCLGMLRDYVERFGIAL